MKSFYYRTITPLAVFARRWHWFLAGGLLVLMFGLGVTSMAGESAIVDEVAHIPSAYSYLHYGDYRLNPEHPPLMKDLASIPLQFMHLKFPDNEPAWTTDVNGQWESGWNFIYHIGNNADAILFWARLPILLVAIGFGIILYRFVWRRWGKAVALLSLFFYALSPNILAHSRYVTTDLGATVFIFLAFMAFIRFVERPSGKNLILLSLGLAAANLAKFNAVLLYPFLLAIIVGVVVLWRLPRTWQDRARLYVGGYITACVASVAWIWLYYIPNTINMPADVQERLIRGSLVSENVQGVVGLLVNMGHSPIFKPLAQYLLGVAMVFVRVTGGNVTYFNGVVKNGSFHSYFPELFLVKTQVAFLILGLAAIVAAVVMLWRRPAPRRLLHRWAESLRQHTFEWTIGLFAAFYFAVAVDGNLNLGIRHILPIYVPLFVLVAIATVKLARLLAASQWRVWTTAVLTVLLAWYAGSTFWIYPSFTAYFNELIGGPANADQYFSDSGVDWGQDLRNLKKYTDAHPEIKQFALDYFGGGDPRYYYCARAYDAQGHLIATADGYDCSHSTMIEWHSQNGRYTGQYIAVSETFLENDRYYSALNGTTGYKYLRAMKPIAKIGYSIYLYKLY